MQREGGIVLNQLLNFVPCIDIDGNQKCPLCEAFLKDMIGLGPLETSGVQKRQGSQRQAARIDLKMSVLYMYKHICWWSGSPLDKSVVSARSNVIDTHPTSVARQAHPGAGIPSEWPRESRIVNSCMQFRHPFPFTTDSCALHEQARWFTDLSESLADVHCPLPTYICRYCPTRGTID